MKILTLCFERDEKRLVDSMRKLYTGGDNNVTYIHFPSDKIGKRRKGFNELLLFTNIELVDSILCTQEYLDVAVKLLWQSKTVKRYFVDCPNPYETEKNDSRVQMLLWDNIAESSSDIILQSGWKKASTGLSFSVEEMDEFFKCYFNKSV